MLLPYYMALYYSQIHGGVGEEVAGTKRCGLLVGRFS